ncbi:MAG: O-antigen ligase family protein [Clostridiales bacterium]|nr:O-antigen ligase family protein [Eubacteriales bacterium]MDH7567784.1 O-antigen ligase family protein [Clostridiales bacterium]
MKGTIKKSNTRGGGDNKPKKSSAPGRKNELPDLITDRANRCYNYIVIFCLAVIPLLVHTKILRFIAPKFSDGDAATGLHYDTFSYYKWIGLILASVFAVILLIIKMTAGKYRLKPGYINLPLLLLVLLLLISLFTAQYKAVALYGLYCQLEGVLTYLCYFALLFCLSNGNFDFNIGKYINICLTAVVLANTVVSVSFFFGCNFGENPIVLALMKPFSVKENLTMQLSTLLANPNYSSGFSAAACSYFYAMSLAEDRKRERILAALMSFISFMAVLASVSSSGFFTLLLVLPAVSILTLVKVRKLSAVKVMAANAVLYVLMLCLFIFSSHKVFNETMGTVPQMVKAVLEHEELLPTHGVYNEPVEAGSQTAKAVSGEGELSGKPPASTGQLPEFDLPQPGVSAGSGRLYIWKHTARLILQKPFLGYGMDTIAYYFPQYDRDKIANLDSYSQMLSKPHSLYLAVAFGAGIPALAVLLLLFILHFISSLRGMLAEKEAGLFRLRLALLAFYIAFLIQWLFNDSILGTSAIFWVLTGIAASLNYNYEKEMRSKMNYGEDKSYAGK